MIQDAVWGVSIAGMGTLAAIFAAVAAGAYVPLKDSAPAIASAYRLRNWLFGLAALGFLFGTYRTLGALPYLSDPQAPSSVAVKRIDATGAQWSWDISQTNFVVGQTVEFYVTSKDVNHGFALYDPDMHIVAQTQAMPGFTNILKYTFSKPGTYQVLCLEYCGVAHHEMKADITVAAQ